MEYVVGILLGLLAGGGAAGAIFFVMKGKVKQAAGTSAEEAERIVSDAKKNADNMLAEAKLDAKNEALKALEKIEQELDKDLR
jgi:F0F1-type ATP synthase membrane subunit b/b'